VRLKPFQGPDVSLATYLGAEIPNHSCHPVGMLARHNRHFLVPGFFYLLAMLAALATGLPSFAQGRLAAGS